MLPDADMAELVFRLLCSLGAGAAIGIEREKVHRPAGMRTHMLVALGSCIVMVTSQLLYAQYHALGSNADPARLSAQVIAGVGFLGAGTIIRDGSTVKGLTTAASIWTVACLGITIGAGYLFLGLAGTFLTLLTLVLFEWIQENLLHCKRCRFVCRLSCRNVAASVDLVYSCAAKYNIHITAMDTQSRKDCLLLSFHAEYNGKYCNRNLQHFLSDICGDAATLWARVEPVHAS